MPEAEEDAPKGSYKPWVILAMVLIGGAACGVLFLLKKRHRKHWIAVLVAVAVAVVFVCVTDFQSPDAYYSGKLPQKENAIGTVTVTIRCDEIVGLSDASYIPADGVILKATAFPIAEGDSVYTILNEAAQAFRIQVENNGSAELAYITGIHYLYEHDFGELSGWTYFVNGVSPSVGCGEYLLSDGDVIEWRYVISQEGYR